MVPVRRNLWMVVFLQKLAFLRIVFASPSVFGALGEFTPSPTMQFCANPPKTPWNREALECRIAALEAHGKSIQEELALLRKAAREGGLGFDEAVCENVHKPGLQGMIIKVNHVSRIVSDAEKSRAFYEDLLGARRLNRPNFPSPGHWLWLGNVQLHLIQGANAAVEASHAEGVATGNVNHISMEVYDFGAVEAKLKKIGYPYKKNRVPEGGNVIHQIFLTDPDGHYIEICDCNLFSSFVFGPPPDPVKSAELASAYLEGVDPTGASVAAIAALSFLPTMSAKSQDELNESLGMLQRAFKLFAKGDDFIEAKDFGTVLKRMGHRCTEEEVTAMLAKADSDKSGHLCFKEFCVLMAPKLRPDHTSNELEDAFNVIDRDGSGCVTEDELLVMLWGVGQRVNEEELSDAIKKVDHNGDGKVNFKEFLTLFETMHRGVGV